MVVSHPILPLYLTTNNKGIISTWSYLTDSKKSMDEFFLEKPNKDMKTKITKRLNFNSYGNEFLTVDNTGNLYIFAFEKDKLPKFPKISLWTTSNKSCKDAVFLNNSGVIVSTSNSEQNKSTTLYDFLLPLNQANVGNINIGGNYLASIASDASIAVCNDKPGLISFIDIRKMNVVNSFQAHSEEIHSIKISEQNNFMVTSSKGKILSKYFLDGFIKIWDLSNKSKPNLIETMQPFSDGKDVIDIRMNLELNNALLYASSGNTIKLLRNKLY